MPLKSLTENEEHGTIAPMDLDNKTGEWNEWRNLVLLSIQKIEAEVGSLRGELTNLKIKNGVVAGLISVIVYLLTLFFGSGPNQETVQSVLKNSPK